MLNTAEIFHAKFVAFFFKCQRLSTLRDEDKGSTTNLVSTFASLDGINAQYMEDVLQDF